MAHLVRRQKLRFLDIDDGAGFGHGLNQVGLARQECGQLNDIGHFGGRRTLFRLVHIGDHRYAESFFDPGKDIQTLF